MQRILIADVKTLKAILTWLQSAESNKDFHYVEVAKTNKMNAKYVHITLKRYRDIFIASSTKEGVFKLNSSNEYDSDLRTFIQLVEQKEKSTKTQSFFLLMSELFAFLLSVLRSL
ncbi:MAG: hypothetical protein AAF512_19300 [Pseudomonadota bacterium]